MVLEEVLAVDRLAKFVGGQLLILTPRDSYVFRGQIKAAHVETGEVETGEDYESLVIEMDWLAELEESGWAKIGENVRYEAPFHLFYFREIDGGVLSLYSAEMHELVRLFPPGGRLLDPAKVKGL